MTYQLTRTCKDCKNEDIFELTKIQSAFELYDLKDFWNKKCSKCNSTNCYAVQHPRLILDKEILDIWGNDEKLYLNPQDEEIILAEMHNLPIIIDALTEKKYLKRKIDILIEAVCILLYDNTVSCKEFSEEENQLRERNANVIRPELIKFKDKIIESEANIMDYIKVVVFPELGIG